MTSVPNMKRDKEWKKIENEKKIQYEQRLERIQSSNPFKKNIGLKHQVCYMYVILISMDFLKTFFSFLVEEFGNTRSK